MSSQKKNTPAGFTLVEILMALAITAALLAAVAVAFNASVMNYDENEDIFKAVNSARQAVSRITTQLRTAQAVDPNAPSNECTMITASGENITYRYDSTSNTLYLITNDDPSDSDYVLCKSVDAATFTKYTFLDESTIKVRSVQISMTVSSNGVEQKVSAASVIRRNLQ